MDAYTNDLTREDRDALVAALEGMRADGVERPLIPLDVDVDGDGICDAWGLTDSGTLALISGVDIGSTSWVSDGSGEEGDTDV